jgi:PE-PPE domain
MRAIARSLWVAFLALLGVVVLTVSWTMMTTVQLQAATALIMGGADHPLSTPPDSNDFVNAYMDSAVDNYIDPDPTTEPNPPISRVAVIYPAQFFPVFGSMTFDDSVQEGRSNLHRCLRGQAGCSFNPSVGSTAPDADDEFIVFGYSQSAVVASLVKRHLISGAPPGGPQSAEFFLIANAMRPNGGILARGFEGMTIPGLGITFHGPTPTSSCQDAGPCYETTDAAAQYDLLGGDAPAVPWNLLSWVNSGAAYFYLHGEVPSRSLADPTTIDQGVYGDTHYYLIPARRLPLLMPLEQLGVPGPILAVLDSPLREIVEAGYVRDRSPGEHVPFQLLPVDLVTFVVNLVRSIPVGIDDALQEAGLGRVLGTPDVFRPFGVGGPTYPKSPTADVLAATVDASPTTAMDTSPAATVDASPAVAVDASPAAASLAPAPPADGLEADAPETEADTDTALTAISQQDQVVTGEEPTPAVEPAGTDTDASTPEATKPDLPKVRGPIQFDTRKARPFGDRPLKAALNGLTGQKPTDETATEAVEDGAEPVADSENDAAAA